MASRIRRSEVRGRPPRSRGGVGGRSRSTSAHSSSGTRRGVFIPALYQIPSVCRHAFSTADKFEAYAKKAQSKLYCKTDDEKALFTFDAFGQAAKSHPQPGHVWLDRLASVPNVEIDKLFERLPSKRITELGSKFARRMLDYNRGRLLGLRSELS